MTEKPPKRRSLCLLRLPTFGIALGASVAALLAFAVWMFVDFSFPFTLDVVRLDLGLEHKYIFFPDVVAAHGWDQLGPRLVLFAALAGVGAVATLLVFYRVVFGSRNGRSLRAMFVAVALVALWLTLCLSHESLQSAGFEWRLRRAVQGLKQDAGILLADWPTTDSVLPYSGPYTIDNENPDFLYVEPASESGYLMREWVGPYISRTENGGLLFDYFVDKLEFHPQGRKPSSYTQTVREKGQEVYQMRWFVDHYVELEPNWYFVSYLSDMPDMLGEKKSQ